MAVVISVIPGMQDIAAAMQTSQNSMAYVFASSY